MDRLASPLHEAAHAVVGHLLGYRVRMVVVRRGATLLGFTEHHERTDRSPLEAAADGVTIRFAGRIGELLVPSTGYAEMELPAADRDALVPPSSGPTSRATTGRLLSRA